MKIGEKVYCIHAATAWYTINKIYDVVAHPEHGSPSVQGSDGHYDMLSMCRSKFKKMEKDDVVVNQIQGQE